MGPEAGELARYEITKYLWEMNLAEMRMSREAGGWRVREISGETTPKRDYLRRQTKI